MSELVKLAHNAITAKIFTESKEVKDLVADALSYFVEGAEFSGSFGHGKWDGRSSFFSRRTSTFPAGFVAIVHDKLVAKGYKVQLIRAKAIAALGPVDPKVDEYGNDDPRYDFQPDALHQVERHQCGILRVATGGGKCLGRDTPILMHNGTIKMVQNVVVGDLLMGPDSKPRFVLSVCAGRDPLYRVTPTKGDSYIVNDAHILSLKKTSRGYRGRNRDGEKYPKGEIVNINVEKYLAETNTFRHIHKGWRTGVDFPVGAHLPVDPYFLGVILGDGSVNGSVSVTTADNEIKMEIHNQARIWGLGVNECKKSDLNNKASTFYLTGGRNGGKENPLTAALRSLGIGATCAADKFIPHIYKTASREDRLQLLAGILDTDGNYDGKGLYLIQKNERLLDDCIFLARSLGFSAYKKTVNKTCCNNGVVGVYFATNFSGDLETIPVRLERRKANPRQQKKDHLVVGLTVEPIGEGEYFGFEIDGDSLFMLGDFTVTHNTRIAKMIAARYRRMTLFLTTRGVLMHQMKDDCESVGFKCGVIGDGVFAPSHGINVGMVQTFVARLKQTTLAAERRSLVEKMVKSGARFTEPELAMLAQKAFDEKERDRLRTIKLLEMVEVVIGEEAHEAGGNSYFEILQHCKNANIRVALTATPFMRADAENNMRLMAVFGPILIDISEKLLIDRGILAKPSFVYAKYAPNPKLRKTSPWQRAYQLGIVEAPDRNAKIVAFAKKAVEHGLQVMVLALHVAHGVALKKLLDPIGKTEFLRGANRQTDRKTALKKLKAGKLDILIGTTILDVGVDVPSVGMIILAGGGKAEVALRQRIGRGMRAKKKGENVVFIVDFEDGLNSHLSDHAKQRRAIVEGTPGFDSGVLTTQDFDWSIFSSRKAA